MNISDLFEARLREIDAYLALVDAIERQLQAGQAAFGGMPVTPEQQRILNASGYLQLYNLVEATVTWCVDELCLAVKGNGQRPARDLTPQVRREWIRVTAQTHAELNRGHRLDATVLACEHIVAGTPISTWTLDTAGGGNWDDAEIYELAKRLGLTLSLPREVQERANRKVRNDKAALGLVKELRNRLAHGDLSFAECGGEVTVADLKELRDVIAEYLKAVIRAFERFIEGAVFLVEGRRPAKAAAAP